FFLIDNSDIFRYNTVCIFSLIRPLLRQTAAKSAKDAGGWLLDSCFSVLDVGGAKGRCFGGRRRNCFGRHTPILQIFPKRQMEALLKKQRQGFGFAVFLFRR
ncbi:MAG: hypothetical protein IKU21_04265, partial [Anaerotignum sp.]|nr:hypothetical protein [Anaerotignum sp.]